MDPQIQAALEQLQAALARAGGRRLVHLRALFSDGLVIRLRLPAPRPPPGAASAQGAGSGGLRRLVRDQLLQAGGPLKRATIARRLGRSNSGHFRTTILAPFASACLESFRSSTRKR